MAELQDPEQGFFVNGSLITETEVDTGVEMRKAGRKGADYDCRKETGFVGLKNQGATCYINSVIQSLYHLPAFRKSVYQIPIQNDSLSKSISFALQTLFYNMQYPDSDMSTGTEDLTKSVGRDPSQQADAHEFRVCLFQKLAKEMKGTAVDGTIQELFQGHYITDIECSDVTFSMPTRNELFLELHLVVKGCRDVYESFDKYVEVEKMEGDNQYRTEQFGFQNARKGTKFLDFPPILQLHLTRFDYSLDQLVELKTNDRYEFSLRLDLDRDNGKYLSADADPSVRNLYTLYSVLVHGGLRADSGHYYSLIRPTLSDHWYKFDDNHVSQLPWKTVLEEHCGSDENQSHSMSSAYILMYIRESDKDKVLCTVEQEEIPKQNFPERFEEKREDFLDRLKLEEKAAELRRNLFLKKKQTARELHQNLRLEQEKAAELRKSLFLQKNESARGFYNRSLQESPTIPTIQVENEVASALLDLIEIPQTPQEVRRELSRRQTDELGYEEAGSNDEIRAAKNQCHSMSSAYILMYIRESDKDKVLCTVEQEEIPKQNFPERFEEKREDLLDRLKLEEKAAELRRNLFLKKNQTAREVHQNLRLEQEKAAELRKSLFLQKNESARGFYNRSLQESPTIPTIQVENEVASALLDLIEIPQTPQEVRRELSRRQTDELGYEEAGSNNEIRAAKNLMRAVTDRVAQDSQNIRPLFEGVVTTLEVGKKRDRFEEGEARIRDGGKEFGGEEIDEENRMKFSSPGT